MYFRIWEWDLANCFWDPITQISIRQFIFSQLWKVKIFCRNILLLINKYMYIYLRKSYVYLIRIFIFDTDQAQINKVVHTPPSPPCIFFAVWKNYFPLSVFTLSGTTPQSREVTVDREETDIGDGRQASPSRLPISPLWRVNFTVCYCSCLTRFGRVILVF